MANTFFVIKLRATCVGDFTDAEGETMCAAASIIAERMRGDMETELQKYFRNDKIEVEIEV